MRFNTRTAVLFPGQGSQQRGHARPGRRRCARPARPLPRAGRRRSVRARRGEHALRPARDLLRERRRLAALGSTRATPSPSPATRSASSPRWSPPRASTRTTRCELVVAARPPDGRRRRARAAARCSRCSAPTQRHADARSPPPTASSSPTTTRRARSCSPAPNAALDAAPPRRRARGTAGDRARRRRRVPLARDGARRRPVRGGARSRRTFSAPAVPVISCATGDADDRSRAATSPTALTAPVRWTATMRALAALGIRRFVDAGPGAVLAKLVARNIARGEVLTIDGFDWSLPVAELELTLRPIAPPPERRAGDPRTRHRRPRRRAARARRAERRGRRAARRRRQLDRAPHRHPRAPPRSTPGERLSDLAAAAGARRARRRGRRRRRPRPGPRRDVHRRRADAQHRAARRRTRSARRPPRSTSSAACTGFLVGARARRRARSRPAAPSTCS